MKKKTSEMTIAELRARAAEIRTEVNAEGADLDALEAEADEISQRIAQYETEQRRLGIAAKVADGAGAPQDNPTAITDAQTRAQQFKENRRAVLGVEETRAVLVSGGKLATPTEVNTEIQDRVGVGVSSIIDMVWVDDCAGMSTDRIPYVKQDADAAADQTEGAAATTKEATYDYIDITPKSEAVLSQISKQAKKLTPVNYFAKCRAQALLSLRKKEQKNVSASKKANASMYTARRLSQEPWLDSRSQARADADNNNKYSCNITKKRRSISVSVFCMRITARVIARAPARRARRIIRNICIFDLCRRCSLSSCSRGIWSAGGFLSSERRSSV